MLVAIFSFLLHHCFTICIPLVSAIVSSNVCKIDLEHVAMISNAYSCKGCSKKIGT